MNDTIEKQFNEELEAYERSKENLLSLCEGKFAVFKGSQFIGVYDNAAAAYNAGVERFGNVPFLIKPVLRQERIEYLPALHLGLIHASL